MRVFVVLTLLQSCLAAKHELSEKIWQLGDLEVYRPTGNVWAGNQNFTWCCIKAVADSLYVEPDGSLGIYANRTDWILAPGTGSPLDPAELIAYSKRSQFPCTAVYVDGDNTGAPVVQVPYTWFQDNCPGWQLNGKANLNAWLQALSGFLLPAVVFCLSVPRRRKLAVPKWLFAPQLDKTSSYLIVIPGALVAGLVALIDTLIWLSMCFAFAGPMILSGMYEALLDNRILDFVVVKQDNNRLTKRMRCRLLMIILIGNLDLALDPQAPPKSAEPVPSGGREEDAAVVASSPTDPCDGEKAELSAIQGSSHTVSKSQQTACHNRSTSAISLDAAQSPAPRLSLQLTKQSLLGQASGDMCSQQASTLTMNTEAAPADGEAMPNNVPVTAQRHTNNHQTDRATIQGPSRQLTGEPPVSPWIQMQKLLEQIPEDDSVITTDSHAEDHFRKTKTRLRTMLHCQYSFGSVVGAPVIFFLGGFIFALLQSLSTIGDEDIALALAFGQWYMTIPHIAIVSGLLLAGNNPNILEGIFATERDVDDDPPGYGLHFELAYPSCYKVAWQWKRGSTKREWINKLIETHTEENFREDREKLKRLTTPSLLDWALVLLLTLLLLGVPFGLAILTAYFTPEIGLSCRSLTFAVYAAVEIGQILLWLWAYAGAPSGGLPKFFCDGGWLSKHGFYNPTTRRTIGDRDSKAKLTSIRTGDWSPSAWSLHWLWSTIWYACAFVLGLVAVFAAIGGTLMQLLGVYSADICNLTVQHWFDVLDAPMVVVSYNSADRIAAALNYWKPCAISAIVFMATVSFMGWWYQRRMRDIFTELVRKI